VKNTPSPNNAPARLNPEAESIWRNVCKKYADDIYDAKTVRRQWAKARAHFERICGLKGVSPYLDSGETPSHRFASLGARLRRLLKD